MSCRGRLKREGWLVGNVEGGMYNEERVCTMKHGYVQLSRATYNDFTKDGQHPIRPAATSRQHPGFHRTAAPDIAVELATSPGTEAPLPILGPAVTCGRVVCASLPLASTCGKLTVIVWNVTDVPSSTRPPETALSVWPLLTSALPPAVRVLPPTANVLEPSATAVMT